MKWIKNLIVFIIRSVFLLVITTTFLARNLMAGLDLEEIENILRIINNYEGSLPYKTQDLFLYNLMYKINDNFLIILILTLTMFLIFEILIKKAREE